MATEQFYQNITDKSAALRQALASRLGPELSANPC